MRRVLLHESGQMNEIFHLTNEIIDSVMNEIEQFGIYVGADELDLVFPDPKDAANGA
ncbi:MAG: hypothetical protein NC355_09965 [Blautia sp.]|nr:hypothetical protein [Blautia sp.]